jgi:hypothetical protein
MVQKLGALGTTGGSSLQTDTLPFCIINFLSLGFTLWRLSNNPFEPECAVSAIKYANLQLLLLLSLTCEPLFLSSHQDRRPLAPATVARLVIKNEDQTLVDDE